MASRRHHYIPIFYLRQWTGADSKVCQFSRPHGRVVAKRRHPSGTAYEDDLYSLSNVPEPLANWLEDVFFKVADQEGNDALQQILSGNVTLNQRLRSGWSRFLMSLFSRVPDKILQLRTMYEEEVAKRTPELERAYDEWHANDVIPPSPQQKTDDIKHQREIGLGQFMQSVMDLENVGNHINNMLWQVFVLSNGRRTLLTSDRPILLSNGLQHPDSHLILPISPTKLFVAANDEATLKRIAQLAASDITSISNRNVVSRADVFSYGVDDYQINFVDKYLRK